MPNYRPNPLLQIVAERTRPAVKRSTELTRPTTLPVRSFEAVLDSLSHRLTKDVDLFEAASIAHTGKLNALLHSSRVSEKRLDSVLARLRNTIATVQQISTPRAA